MNFNQLESKYLAIIDDQMSHEALAAKKSELYARYFTDPTLKQMAQQLSSHHKEHFNCLLNLLQSSTSQAQGGMNS